MKLNETKLKKALKVQIRKLRLEDYFGDILESKVLELTENSQIPERKDKFEDIDVFQHKHPNFSSFYVSPLKYTIKISHKIINKDNLIDKEYESISLDLIRTFLDLIVDITLNLFQNKHFKDFVHPGHQNTKAVNFETIELKKDLFNDFFLKQRQNKKQKGGLLFINLVHYCQEYYKKLCYINPLLRKVFTSHLGNQILYIGTQSPITFNELISYKLEDKYINIYFSFDYVFEFMKNYTINELYTLT